MTLSLDQALRDGKLRQGAGQRDDRAEPGADLRWVDRGRGADGDCGRRRGTVPAAGMTRPGSAR